jgi:SAM-dependent methyltransferase
MIVDDPLKVFPVLHDVKRMYEQYPYPTALVEDALISDLANAAGFLFGDDDLAGWQILDAGCGTGHRTLGLAKQYPKAKVLGVDITESSLAIAQQIAGLHGISNVSFRQENLLDLDLPEQYDLIVSTGVIHHLTDPELGLTNLSKHLADDGLLMIWLYHPFGEFDRLLDRELALLLWGKDRSDFAEGLRVVNELNLSLSFTRYGTKTADLSKRDESRAIVNADAYLNPVVNAYRFQDAIEMIKRAGLQWAAINSINKEGRSLLIDLMRVSDDPYFCLREEEIFKTAQLRERYARLRPVEKLNAIELMIRPTGFNLLAGKGDSDKECGKRIESNATRF